MCDTCMDSRQIHFEPYQNAIVQVLILQIEPTEELHVFFLS